MALAAPGTAAGMPAYDAAPAKVHLVREAGRAHVPEAVRVGAVPGARPPLVGLVEQVLTDVETALPVVAPSPVPPASPTPTPSPAAPPTPAAVGVLLRDTPVYSATLSRTTVPAGAVRLQLQNQGEDPHDLRVQRLDDDSSPGSFASTGPGETRTRTLTLASGEYRLYCTFRAPVVHETAGMRATLTVVSG